MPKFFATIKRHAAAAALLGLALVWASQASQAQTLTAGQVFLANRTDRTLTIEQASYVDSAGNRRRLSGFWTFGPHEEAYLLDGSNRITASRFDFAIRTREGSSVWHSRILDGQGKLVVLFSPENLASHLQATAREVLGRFLAKVAGALVFHKIGEGEPENLGQAFVKATALETRNKLIASAFQDAFPDFNDQQARTAAWLVCKGLDGDYSLNGSSEAEAKAAFRTYLKNQSPNLASAYEVAEFIYKAVQLAQ